MTVEQIRQANANAGFTFFRPNTLRFFKSRVIDEVFEGAGGIFFVTSEKGPHDARAYTVRRFNPVTSDIDTVGVFQGYSRSSQANRCHMTSGSSSIIGRSSTSFALGGGSGL